MGERSDMFPAVQRLITADRLLTGMATPLVHLRRAWDTMAHTLGGEQHLCRAISPSITGVDTLHTADPKVQKRICECKLSGQELLFLALNRGFESHAVFIKRNILAAGPEL